MIKYFVTELKNSSKGFKIFLACLVLLTIIIVIIPFAFLRRPVYNDVIGFPKSQESGYQNDAKLSKDSVSGVFVEEIEVKGEEGDVPKEILDFEAMVVPGLGDEGETSDLNQTADDINDQMKKYSFNKYVSDRISLRRSLPDVRHPNCREKKYAHVKDLPKVSVVIIFCNEALSVVTRTIWSVYDKSPKELIQEFVLVDDGSTSSEITDLLPKYIRHRMAHIPIKMFRIEKQSGLIKARLVGAKRAVGEIIMFLDSHCEVVEGWLEPLADHIKHNPNSVAIPNIDSIGDKYLDYFGDPGSNEMDVGSFTWSGLFMWEKLRPIPENRKAGDTGPTPVMAGGLFAINRKFFWDIGSYDADMTGWGGENLEMSWRIWMCGGSLIVVPCSHVGHIFRATNPYPIDVDNMYVNNMRAIEVWMDDYKRLFYLGNQHMVGRSAGDLQKRKSLRETLNCKDFTWYLENVAVNKFVIDKMSLAWGSFKNPATDFCFDNLNRDNLQRDTPFNLAVYPCHGVQNSMSQMFSFSLKNELRSEIKCAHVGYHEGGLKSVVMTKCKGLENQQWMLGENNTIIHKESGECVTTQTEMSLDLLVQPCDGSNLQEWIIEFRKQ